MSSFEMSSSEMSSSESSSFESSPDTVSHGTDQKLVYMANRIGTFFKSQDLNTASAKIADHIIKFWDPRMRRAIVAHLDAGGAGLDPAARQAIETLRSSS